MSVIDHITRAEVIMNAVEGPLPDDVSHADLTVSLAKAQVHALLAVAGAIMIKGEGMTYSTVHAALMDAVIR